MTITKEIHEIYTLPELDGVINAITVVDWKAIFTNTNGTSTGFIRTEFPSSPSTPLSADALAHTEILDECIAIEGGQPFLDMLSLEHGRMIDLNNKVSISTKFNPPIDRVKTEKLVELSQACETAIISGFESSALGTAHTYQSDRDDQLNLVGMVTANVDDYFKCFDGNTWDYRLHTASQLHQVLIDGKDQKLAHLQRFATLKGQLDLAVSEAEVSAIVW